MKTLIHVLTPTRVGHKRLPGATEFASWASQFCNLVARRESNKNTIKLQITWEINFA